MALLLISSTRVRNLRNLRILRILRKYNLNDCSVVTTMSDTSDDKKSMTARNKSLHTHVVIAPKCATVFALNAFKHPVIVKKQNAHLSRILLSSNVRKSRHCRKAHTMLNNLSELGYDPQNLGRQTILKVFLRHALLLSAGGEALRKGE